MNEEQKQKLKKAGIWFAVYLVIFTGIEIAATVLQHTHFRPNIPAIVFAALICAAATVYIPKIWR